MDLRLRGIYRLPNGRELVVTDKVATGDVLFRLRGWGSFEQNQYEVNQTGRLSAQGKLTAWDIRHLADTGQTAIELSPIG